MSDRPLPGAAIIRADYVGTALFILTAVLAAVFFTTALQWIGAVTALTLFAVGVFCFLWSYVHAVQRSRTDDISVSGLYLLAGPATPSAVRRQLLGLLAVQADHRGGDDVRPPRRSRRRAGLVARRRLPRPDARVRAQRAVGGVARHLPSTSECRTGECDQPE